ncbi:MAG TPA: arginine deiminase family protein [Myxococcales bacterium]|jgi:dimethylargininase|nr:arginine deiminase family protein [Myxococcales bacterium]
MSTRAIVRTPGPDFAAGITTADLGPPDFALMRAQHAAYVDALRNLGLAVEVLDPLPGFPDAYFVEDVAVVVPELAVVTRPGAEARRGEAEAIVAPLARHRPLARLEAPATLDGGDVLVAGRTVLIGLSARTNEEGARQLARLLEPHGYQSVFAPVVGGLHLKSSVNWLGGETLLVSGRFAGRPELGEYRQIRVDETEEAACNVLLVNGTLLAPAGFPRTRRQLREAGLPVVELDVSETRKMDGGLTCMSLRL